MFLQLYTFLSYYELYDDDDDDDLFRFTRDVRGENN